MCASKDNIDRIKKVCTERRNICKSSKQIRKTNSIGNFWKFINNKTQIIQFKNTKGLNRHFSRKDT